MLLGLFLYPMPVGSESNDDMIGNNKAEILTRNKSDTEHPTPWLSTTTGFKLMIV